MRKKYSDRFIQVFTILILAVFPLQLIFSAVQKDTGVPTFEEEEAVFWGETTIEVIEGELTVYEFAIAMGEKELGVFLEQEMIEAVLFKIISDDLAKVTIRDEGLTADAYIPVHLRKIIKKHGYSGMPVLVVEHHRELYDTDWDIVALGKVIKAGEVYVSGTIFPVIKEPAQVTGAEKVLAEASYPSIIEFPIGEITEEIPPPSKPPDEPSDEPSDEPPTAALEITTSSVDSATELVSYEFTLSASGGSGDYTWSLVSGNLPSGLSLSSSGVIGDMPASGSGGSGTMDSDGITYTFTVKVSDEDDNTAEKAFTLKVGYRPKGITNYFYVANNTSLNVSKVEKTSLSVSSTSSGLDLPPWGISVDDQYIWVSTTGMDSGIARLDKSNLTITTYILAGGAVVNHYGIAVDNTHVYVADNTNGQLRKVRKSDGQLIGSLAIANAWGVAVDDKYIWVTKDQLNAAVVRVLKSDFATTNEVLLSYTTTRGVAVDGTYAWVAEFGGDRVEAVHKENLTIDKDIGVGDGPYGIAVDGSYVWVSNNNVNSVSKINKTTSGVSTIAFGVGDTDPRGVSVDGTYAYVAINDSDREARITASNDSVSYTGIAVAPTGPISIGDATGYNYDQFWTSSRLVDPHIHGRVYDSVTGENVSDVYIGLYRYRDGALMGTTTSNPYSFNVDVANYFLRVEKAGFTFPSKNVGAKVSGDHGEVFQGSSLEHVIDIPIDPGYPLTITKTANKKEVMIGDIITFNIEVENNNSIATLNEIVIEDEITAGFKYVTGSTYFDSDKESDPAIASRAASFNIGKIPRYATINVSYQVRVGTGVVPGTYKTDAVAKDSYRGWQMSEESGVKIDVIKDPLFELGTIIGKVFVDNNGNGVQDGETEAGVPNVKLAAEYGVVVYTDEFGRYHIPAVPPGTHLLKLDVSSLSKSEIRNPKSEIKITTENPYLVKITEGLLGKVNFGVQGIDTEEIERRKEQLRRDWAFPEDRKEREEEELGAKSNSFFLVALGEGIVRNLSTSGNIDMVDHDERFKDGIHVNGKLAYYLKAKVLGKFLVTSSLDTDRKKNQLFTNLDPDKYYPVYGDASQIDFSATDTQNEFYVMVEYEKSSLVWGDFHTDIPEYSRTLHGAKLDYESNKKTKFDDPYTTAKAFFANERQIGAHDEFLGTGTSLYYLRHRDVVEGSEKMHVEVRHQVSKVVLASYPLREEIDYEIDYDTGRVLLKRPLTSVDYLYSDSIISNDILRGNRVYLIADYEYQPEAGIRFDTWGGQATQQIGDHIMVGGTYINEEKADTHYELAGGDLVIKVNKETEVRGEYNYSEETQLGSTISSDGGLSFVEESDTFSSGKSGNSWAVSGKTKLFKNTDVNAVYADQDPYYSTTNSLATQGSRRLIANVISHITENLAVGISHITQRLLSDTERVQSYLTGTNRAHTTTALLDYNPGKYDVRLEYQHQRVVNLISSYTYFGTRQLRDNDFIAGRVGYRFTDWLRAYLRGQGTISGMANNQGTIGSEIRVSDKLSLNIAETIGNLGNSTLLGMSSKYGEDSDIYANIEIGSDAYAGSYTKTTYGQTSYIGKEERVYVETDYSSYKESLLSGNVIGYEKKLGNNLALGVNYERSFVEKDVSAFSRDAGGMSLSYLDQDSLKISSKLECREDNNSDETRQWVTQNEIMWRLTDSITTFGRANYSLSTDRIADSNLAEFKEMGAGLAYRPVKSDRLNLLGKISYIEDDAPDSQLDFAQSSEERRYVYALEGAYDIFRYLQLVGKFAYKDNQEKVGPRDFTESDTYLYIGRLNFHITRKWDIAGEYRVLQNTQTEDQRNGWLVEINRELLDHVWLGAGYNFTDFDDDLEHDNDYDAKGWFVRAVGKY